jgi:peptidoglycan/xylan/chitin deacetylase (PgdA/CDA1 family)
MFEKEQISLCLLAHGLTEGTARPPRTSQELFISVDELDGLLEQLAREDFEFRLPDDASTNGQRTCAVTFDDGYANNALFLPLAQKYRIPFVLFLSSLNVEEQIPFVWDVKNLASGARWRHWNADYRHEYQHLDRRIVRDLAADDNHRPFTLDELRAFADSPWTYLGLHTHSHQPLVGRFLAKAEQEITENARFLAGFPRVLTRDLALPCGLYTRGTNKSLLSTLVDRVYTCDGGRATFGASVVHRIPLINPLLGGTLISQVARATRARAQLRRKLANVRYSNPLFSRF